MDLRKKLLGMAAAAALGILWSGGLNAAEPIKIGDLNSYTAEADFTQPYKNGWTLAVDEINAAGGVLGRPIQMDYRDDGGEPGKAVTAAEDLNTKDNVALLSGTYYSNVGVAVTNYAKQREKLFVATEPMSPDITWKQGNRYTFRLRANTYEQTAMLAEEAAKLPVKRWAIVAPNFKFGQDAAEAFTKLMKKARPDVEFVTTQWPELGKIDAGATVQALIKAKPEGIFCALFSDDLSAFVREGKVRGLLTDKVAGVGLLTGEPEYLDPMGAEAPQNWIVTGYPWYSITGAAHDKFVKDYEAKFNKTPGMGSLIGYTSAYAIKAMIEKAGSLDQDKLIHAMEGLTFQSVVGPITFRALDHQSTMGAWVGRTAVKDGKPIMVDWHYAEGPQYFPSDEEIKAMRPSD